MFIINKVKTLCSSGVNWINWLTRSVLVSVTIECKFVLHTNSPRKGGMIGTVYPNSSLKCNLLIYFQDSVSWHLPKSYKEQLVTVHVLRAVQSTMPNAGQ